MATPRTRQNRLSRNTVGLDTSHVGDNAMEETCPRCGWPCDHLVRACWDSEWNEHGGICSLCCQEAVIKFDATQWPEDPALARETATPMHLWEED